MKRVAIVGGGAAGLFAAYKLSSVPDLEVCVFEKARKVGTKLRASGGGRANLMNTHIDGTAYNQPDFMDNLLQTIDYKRIKSEFNRMGLWLCHDDEGRVYPRTLFSQSVIDVLLGQMGTRVQFFVDTRVQYLRRVAKKWQINSIGNLFDFVILATGSPAGMIAKNQQNYNDYFSSLHLKTNKLQPSLTGFKLANYPKELAGCRVKAIVSLRQGGKTIYSESGEVMFKEDGISGIVVLNISAVFHRLPSHDNSEIAIDLIGEDKSLDIAKHLKKFGTLSGIIHPKLWQYYQTKPFDLSNLHFSIKGLYDMEFAQVCHGGILLSELVETFELRQHHGVYAIGEMVDIDGKCGGYNLFFAFASACRAAEAILISK